MNTQGNRWLLPAFGMMNRPAGFSAIAAANTARAVASAPERVAAEALRGAIVSAPSTLLWLSCSVVSVMVSPIALQTGPAELLAAGNVLNFEPVLVPLD